MEDTWEAEASASASERTQKTSFRVSFSATLQVDSAVLDVFFDVSAERKISIGL